MSSGFISEAEISDQRKRRQEEWDRVRTADQPEDAPEAPYDPRCLYDRLQEQKNKRDVEYEEAHKLKNMIKGLDDDEIEFLDLVDRTKMEEERKKNMEEEKEMRDFKAKVASLQEKTLDERLKQELKQPMSNKSTTSSNKVSQLKLLAGVVKKPAKTEAAPAKGMKRKLSDSKEDSTEKKNETNVESKKEKGSQENAKSTTEKEIKETKYNTLDVSADNPEFKAGALKCVGILPGLGSYEDSSDTDCSSDSEQDSHCRRKKLDILGREIIPAKSKDYVEN